MADTLIVFNKRILHGFLPSFSSSYYNRLNSREKGCFRGKKSWGLLSLMGGAFLHSFLCYNDRNMTVEVQMSTIFDYLKEVTYDSSYMTALHEAGCLRIGQSWPISPWSILCLKEIQQEFHAPVWCDGTDRSGLPILSKISIYHRRVGYQSVLHQTPQLCRWITIPMRKTVLRLHDHRLSLMRIYRFQRTDDTLIGWKEDFHMTYMDHVPACSARKQLPAKCVEGNFQKDASVAGHLKGESATGACTYLPTLLFKRVDAIYSLRCSRLQQQGHYRNRRPS